MMKQLYFSLLALTLVGCSYRHEDQAYYTRAAFEKQQLEIASLEPARIDQIDPSTRTLDLTEEMREEWQRLPWETVDDWMERIQNQLVLNNNLVLHLREQLQEISAREKGVIGRLQQAIAANERMRGMMDELEPVDELAGADLELLKSLPTPTFHIHLVGRGETLYSIANYYYNDPGMIDDIMLWNQGWLRNPHQLLAGIALVLFDEKAPEKNEQVVEHYISQIPDYR